MKKLTKTAKLALSTQTIRQLDDAQLVPVAGGVPVTYRYTCVSFPVTCTI